MKEQYLDIAEFLKHPYKGQNLEDPTQREMNKPLPIDQPHLRVVERLDADDSQQHDHQEISDVLDKNLVVTSTSKETEHANGPEDVKKVPIKHCSEKCPAYGLNGSKASATSTRINAGTGSLCEWCKRKFPANNIITPEIAIEYIVDENAREMLEIKKPFYSKMANNVIASNAGKPYLDKDWFAISQILLKVNFDAVLPGMKHPMSNIPLYLHRSSLKYTINPYSRRPTVTLNPKADLVKELIRKNKKKPRKIYEKKSWNYRFYFADLENFKDWRGQSKVREEVKAATRLVTLENL